MRWTLVPAASPRPLRHCSTCGIDRPFASSGLFRLNANGRRLDAWLIYRCTACDRTWNRTVFERRVRGDIADDMLEGLEANDADLARRIENDVSRLGALAQDPERRWTVETVVLTTGSQAWTSVRLEIAAPAGGPRLDRLLCNELGLSRRTVVRMAEEGRLLVEAGTADRLRRAVSGSVVLTFIEPGVALLDRAKC
ncbi:MAG: DUF1062 domain-containing protein [Rhizobiaceae bacterium]